MPLAFIFDFGGVLMKTADYAPRHNWDKRLGLSLGSVEKAVHNADSWVSAQKGEIPVTAYWDDVQRSLGISAEEIAQLAEDFYAGDVLDQSLIQLIENLRSDGHIVGLLSNDSLELEDKLQRLNIQHLFDPLVISAKVGMMKPDRAIYAHVLSLLPAQTYPVIFIDDRVDNIHGAMKAGMVGVLYQPKMWLEKILRDLCHAHDTKMR